MLNLAQYSPMSRLGALVWAWLPVLVWMALILGLSGQANLPARQNPATGEVIRSTYTLAKLAHVVEYGVLGLLLLRATMLPSGGPGLRFASAAAWTVVAATLFGGVDELRQSLVPNREPRLGDVLLDGASALGAVCAVAVARCVRLRRDVVRTRLRPVPRPVAPSPTVGE